MISELLNEIDHIRAKSRKRKEIGEAKSDEKKFHTEHLEGTNNNEDDEDVKEIPQLSDQTQKIKNEERNKENETKNSVDEKDNPEVVTRRLREMALPVRLFAESDLDRVKRLKLSEIYLHEKNTSSKGTANFFAKIHGEIESAMEEKRARDLMVDIEAKRIIEKKANTTFPGPEQNSFKSLEDYLLSFFNMLLTDWQHELEMKPHKERKSREGKKATAIFLQTKEYIQPFFKHLEEQKCASDILKPVERIVSLMRKREYLLANNEYLTMSIGNAPWPMGLTMVSIHERKGRSKIYSNQIAHILNDEETRKYIQSIKRLLTFCQKQYPPSTACKKF